MSVAVKLDEKYSYADYLNWSNEERWELIDGVPYNMSPAPSTGHQSISQIVSNELYNFLKKNKNCKVFSAPFDVRFHEKNETSDDEIFTVVQPDISVICDETKLNTKGCNGAPDITVEILSPSTSYKDETTKLRLYEKHGVKEYWIINPDAKYIMIYRLKNGEFDKPEYLKEKDTLKSQVLKEFEIELSEIWN